MPSSGSTSRRLPAPIWRALLLAIDDELTEPATLVVIGGAAIALAYTGRYSTIDLDTITRYGAATEAAVERAREKVREQYGLEVAPPVRYTGVFNAPREFERRLRPLRLRRSRWLTALVPEHHDLALMKVARGEERDLAALADVHRVKPFVLTRGALRGDARLVRGRRLDAPPQLPCARRGAVR